MRTQLTRLIAIAVALAIPAAAPAATQPAVKAPKSGSEYRSGSPSDVIIRISGRSVELMAISFPCGEVSGRTTINDFRLKRTSRGYRFNADANGLVGYSDEGPDENAEVHVSGRFSRDARTVRGHLRVKSERCGDTGNLKWSAKRAPAA